MCGLKSKYLNIDTLLINLGYNFKIIGIYIRNIYIVEYIIELNIFPSIRLCRFVSSWRLFSRKYLDDGKWNICWPQL